MEAHDSHRLTPVPRTDDVRPADHVLPTALPSHAAVPEALARLLPGRGLAIKMLGGHGDEIGAGAFERAGGDEAGAEIGRGLAANHEVSL